MVVRRLVPSPIRRRYAVKFGIVLLILGLSVGAIGFVATAAITDAVEQRVQDDQQAFADSEADNLDQWIRQNKNTVRLLGQSDIIATDSPDAIESEMEDWAEESDAFAISYVDTEGEEVLASSDANHREATPEEIAGNSSEPYEDADSIEVGISEPFLDENEEGEESVVVSFVRQTDQDRAVVYTADFDRYIRLIGGLDETTILILNEDNEVVGDNAELGNDYEMFGEPYHDDDLVEDAHRESTVSEDVDGPLADSTYGFDTDEYVVTAASTSETGWTVMVHEPTEEAYGFVQTVDEYGTYATAGGVLLIGLFGMVLGRNTAVSIDRLTAKARRMEDGDLDVDFETKRIDNIGRLYDGFDSMQNALREQIQEAEDARQEAERERERVQRINERLERKADEYSEVMEAAADGDLTARMDADTENEAMAEIGEDFNEMLAEIERTVAELDRFATQVATASEEVTASSEEVRSASVEVTESVQQISEGASRQNESLQSVNREMNGLSTTTEQIAASSNQVADVAERTARTGQTGREAAESAVNAMADIEEESDVAVEEIRRLEEEVHQIDELIATIRDIAQQTNMLALNANIEASRSAGSGGGGEGFSVVAKQVKELSEDVEKAANAAEKRLEAIRKQTAESATEVEQTSEHIEHASEEVERAVKALEEIAEFARETNNGVQEISAATEQQAATTQEVVAMVDEAATISEETTAEAQNVAAAAEEQTSAMTEVSESASDLTTKASDLSAALDRFELDVDETDDELLAEDAELADDDLFAGEDVAVAAPVAGEDAVEAADPVAEEHPSAVADVDPVSGEEPSTTDTESDDGDASAEGASEPAGPATDSSVEPDETAPAEPGEAAPAEPGETASVEPDQDVDPFEELDLDDDPLAFSESGAKPPAGGEPEATGEADADSATESESEESDEADSEGEDEVFSFGDLDENP